MDILVNRMTTPDGTTLISRSRHDYVEHLDKNGKVYMLDGGTDYIRCSSHGDELMKTVYVDDPYETIRKRVEWGVMRDWKHTYIPIKRLSKAHINNIINDGYTGKVVDVMKYELKWREEHEKGAEAKRLEIQREASY